MLTLSITLAPGQGRKALLSACSRSKRVAHVFHTLRDISVCQRRWHGVWVAVSRLYENLTKA
jgi:hypothetical protein